MRVLLISLLVACSASDSDETSGSEQTGGSEETGATSFTESTGGTGTSGAGSTGSTSGATSTGALHGSAPEVAVSAPEFSATNMDGSGRDRSDLLGGPSVLWFYPWAGTPG